MLRFLVFSTLLLGTQLHAAGWSCQTPAVPSECSGSVLDKYSAQEHACLLKLYTCGRHIDLISRIESSTVGLAREQNYFLGASYFGLSLRTDAQSLKCFYSKRAKSQLEEFILATENDAASAVSYGSDAEMDMLYHATRTFDLLKKEPGCSESSYSEGTLYRMARLYTNQRMNNLLHDSPDTNDGAAEASRLGFKGMRDTLNLFVTEASKLESRFSLYSSQIDSSNSQLQKVAQFLQKEALSESIIDYSTDDKGAFKVTVDQDNLKEFLDNVDNTLQTQGISVLTTYEAQFNDYAKKNSKYYDSLREDNLKAISLIISRIATNVNTFKNSSDGAKALRAVDDQPEGRLVSLTRMGQVWAKYKPRAKTKCSSPFGPKWWYCN
jgi:hypothetical protein